MSKELKAEINKGYNTFKVFEALKEKLGDLESIESATKGAEKLKAKLEKDIEKLEQNRRGVADDLRADKKKATKSLDILVKDIAERTEAAKERFNSDMLVQAQELREAEEGTAAALAKLSGVNEDIANANKELHNITKSLEKAKKDVSKLLEA